MTCLLSRDHLVRASRATTLGTLLLASLPLFGCAKDPVKQVAENAEVRTQVIEALVSDAGRRTEVINRLMSQPADRKAVVDRIIADEDAKGTLVSTVLADDRGKALIAGKVAADDAGAKTFIRMLMTTGVMGSSLTQKQADALGYGDAYSYGTRRRTMGDLKHMGRALDAWAKAHNGAYPVCNGLDDVRRCLGKALGDQMTSLRLDDAWGKPLMYWSDKEGKEYLLLSYATDGMWDGAGRTGPTDNLDCDIVFSNGDFAQWPGSFRKDEIQ
jgi:Tfp pilus assembly major pilin PilA